MFLFFPLPKNLVWQPALSASVCPCISWNSSLHSSPIWTSPSSIYVCQPKGAVCEYVCKCTCANCVVLPGTVLPIPEDYCLCKCVYVCVRAWNTAAVSSYLSVLMTEHQCISRSSYPLELHPDRHMSNNAWLESNNTMKSRTCTLLWETRWGRRLNRDQNWMDRVYHIIKHNYQVWLGTRFTITLYEWGLCHEFEIDDPLSPVFECSVSANNLAPSLLFLRFDGLQ